MHFALLVNAMLSHWLPPAYMFYNILFMVALMWAIHCRESVDAIHTVSWLPFCGSSCVDWISISGRGDKFFVVLLRPGCHHFVFSEYWRRLVDDLRSCESRCSSVLSVAASQGARWQRRRLCACLRGSKSEQLQNSSKLPGHRWTSKRPTKSVRPVKHQQLVLRRQFCCP